LYRLRESIGNNAEKSGTQELKNKPKNGDRNSRKKAQEAQKLREIG